MRIFDVGSSSIRSLQTPFNLGETVDFLWLRLDLFPDYRRMRTLLARNAVLSNCLRHQCGLGVGSA